MVQAHAQDVAAMAFGFARTDNRVYVQNTVESLVDMPGMMMCEKCLPTERAIAVGRYDADMSADEH